MVPLIVRVYGEGDDVLATDVPVTPDTTCRDVIECCRDPGEEPCALVETWGTCERTLGDNERPLQILQDWGSHQVEIKFMLRYLQEPVPSRMLGGRNNTRNGMKEPGLFGESPSDGVELSLGELQDMATRQQHQIDSQHQLLVAKEQRLRFLKHQEARAHQVASENERLRRLRDRVEAQEQKLRKLRALRGQVDHNKVSNASLTSDLDSIRGLFNEKEKELSLAVAKVEELTRQLEDVKRGKGANKDQGETTSPAVLELDKLRRELMYRNKLNEQQNARLSQQREALTQRQEEMTNIDKRISELQDRLHQKRLLNQQLANQITAASHKASGQQNRGAIPGGPLQQHPYQHPGKLLRPVTSGNIAAVEPYHHVPVSAPNTNVPLQQGGDMEKPLQRHPNPSSIGYYQKGPPLQNREVVTGPFLKHTHQPDGIAASEIKPERPPSQDDIHTKLIGNTNHQPHLTKKEEEFYLPEFGGSKSDPKYQTLPYNTKFTVNFLSGTKIPSTTDKISVSEDVRRNDANESSKNNNNNINNINNNINYVGSQNPPSAITVLSAPPPTLLASHKGLAKGVSNQNQELPANYQPGNKAPHMPNHPGLRPYGPTQQGYGHPGLQFGLTRGQPVGGTSSTTSSTSSLATNSSASSSNSHQKPVSSVAPTSIHQKPSPIYQTSSTKIQPVQPQTLSSTPHGLREVRVDLSPPQGSSTPQGTPEVSTPKPALPPKPAVPIKPAPPPRQAHAEDDLHKGHRVQDHHSHQVPLPPPLPHELDDPAPPPPSSEPPEDLSTNRKPPAPAPTPVSSTDVLPIIKARPLTIKKQPISEHPKLKLSNLNGNGNGTTNSIATNNNVHVTINRRIEMPPAFLFPENEAPPADLVKSSENASSTNMGPASGPNGMDEADRVAVKETEPDDNGRVGEHYTQDKPDESPVAVVDTLNNINLDQQFAGGDAVHIVRRRKGNLKASGPPRPAGRRVSFDPLALLLDAALEGELELVKRTAGQVTNPSAANDEGITALHNAICAGHLEIVKFLVEFGCDVNAQDSDGWTPLHCAASCNNLAMVRFLVEHGACIFATTLSDHETAAEKCEEDEEGFDGCSEYLYSVQEKLGILHNGIVYAVFDYEAHHPDELNFREREQLIVLRKGDESEREWWWSKLGAQEGYIPRNLLGLYPRVHPSKKQET